MRNERCLLPDTLTPATTGLCVYLLGPLRIERDGQPIHLPRRKVEALLAYLLLHPEPQTRDHLATLFWGDSSDAQARHSLRTALATVRKEVAADLLLTDREQVQRNPDFPCWVDLYALLAVRQELETIPVDALQAQLALWQGELLAGFYDDWVTATREHYQLRLTKLALQATQTLRARSEYAQAIVVAQRLLTFDPANEQAHQHLMFCYMAAGDRSAALRQYELCERVLEEELAAPPLPETTALYQWLKQTSGQESSTAAKITNLPIPLTTFVGRTEQMTAVKRLLDPAAGQTRLLTLTGAGGSGKTRLAIQTATDLIDRFAHGVWWVELAALTANDQVVRAVAKALGVNEARTEPLLQSLVNFLHDKALLLVLDNCEHLVAPVAELAAELLSRCPGLQLLATSREALAVAGENLWPVPTLLLPEPRQVGLTELLLQFECIRLFHERALAVQPHFHLTLENAPAVVEICTRLDGIPLAIELAAARVKVLPVEQIAARLTSAIGARFDLLTQGSRTVPPRQQTLRAAIDWSYDLLDETERQLFRIVALFRGGFTLEALEQITCAAAPIDYPLSTIHHPLDLLTQLVDKSLVMVEPQGEQNRYGLLETLREYALEQWPSGEERICWQRRHAAYFLALAEQAEPELIGLHQQVWLNRLEVEHANLRAAFDDLLSASEVERALRLAAALVRFWDYRGYVGEGRERLRRALAQRTPPPSYPQAKALGAAGGLALRQSDYDQARPLLTEALAWFTQLEQEQGMAETLQNLAMVEMSQGDYVMAQQRLTQSLELSRAIAYDYGIGRALNTLGNLAWEQERITDAHECYQQSLAIFQHLGDPVNITIGFLNVGSMELELGNAAAARTNFETCLRMSRTIHNEWLTGMALKCLGWVAFDQQEYPQAHSYGIAALRIFQQVGDKINIGQVLGALGDAAAKVGEHGQAFAYYCQHLQTVYGLGHKRACLFALHDIARLLTRLDQHPESVVRLWGAADQLRMETGMVVAPQQQAQYEQAAPHIRQQLGDSTFQALWGEGQTTPLAEIVPAVTRLAL